MISSQSCSPKLISQVFEEIFRENFVLVANHRTLIRADRGYRVGHHRPGSANLASVPNSIDTNSWGGI